MECVIEFEDGKYTYVSHNDGRQYALRHGEQWRDFIGDKFVYCMAARIVDLQIVNDASRVAAHEAAQRLTTLEHALADLIVRHESAIHDQYDGTTLLKERLTATHAARRALDLPIDN